MSANASTLPLPSALPPIRANRAPVDRAAGGRRRRLSEPERQLAPGRAMDRRRVAGRGAVSRVLRLHPGLARVRLRPPWRWPARADVHAGPGRAVVLPRAVARLVVRPAGGRLRLAAGRVGAAGRLPVRHRHAAGRRLRLGHVVRGRRRQYPHGGHAVVLHRRLGHRHGQLRLVVGAAGAGADLAGQELGPGARADRQPGRLRADRLGRHRAGKAPPRSCDLLRLAHRATGFAAARPLAVDLAAWRWSR